MEEMNPWPDDPPIRVQECPLCGGEVQIGPASSVWINDGVVEHWTEAGSCTVCHAGLVRELIGADKPVVFMTRGDWRHKRG